MLLLLLFRVHEIGSGALFIEPLSPFSGKTLSEEPLRSEAPRPKKKKRKEPFEEQLCELKSLRGF